VGGDDHSVEPVRLPRRVAHLGVVRAGPDRGDQRQGEVGGEVGGEPARSEKIGESLSDRVRLVQAAAGGAVESRDLGQHMQVAAAAAGQAGGQAGQAALARVLQAAARAADRHAHAGGLGGHGEFGEQPGE
jgi:hypothetical protein